MLFQQNFPRGFQLKQGMGIVWNGPYISAVEEQAEFQSFPSIFSYCLYRIAFDLIGQHMYRYLLSFIYQRDLINLRINISNC